jgi:1,4-dihydroxy-2-naphthoate octaprenyltransferase
MGGSRILYGLLSLTPFLIPLLMSTETAWVLLALPLAVWLVHRFFREPPGPAYNRILARTAQLQLVYGLLISGALLF